MAHRLGPRSVIAVALVLTACGGPSGAGTDAATAPQSPSQESTAEPTPPVPVAPPASAEATTPDGTDGTSSPDPSATAPGGVRPDWLGTRVLPERPDGLGEIRDTPPELVDRRFPPPDARPVADGFTASVGPVPEDVLARSTSDPECPVETDELRYITMKFWGFDDRSYLGEMIVNESVAADVVDVFERIYQARFPIEQMRVVDAPELDAPPTGDGNNTTAFVCRPTTLEDSWSEHAYGRAIDINPFHNPYVRDDAVLPELASAYLDRDRNLPGMISEGDVVTDAFADIGWGWGGDWSSLKDWMHFSASGR